MKQIYIFYFKQFSYILMEYKKYIITKKIELKTRSDDAFFQPELGWSVWGSLGWTKTADGLN